MNIFGENNVGCFVRARYGFAAGEGAVLAIVTGDNKTLDELPSNITDPFVVTGINFGQKENVHFQQAFNDRIYTYAFGAGLGQLDVQFAAFMGRKLSDEERQRATAAVTTVLPSPEETLARMLSVYSRGRVSQSKGQAVLSIGDSSVLRGPIIGMQSGTSNTEVGLQTFSITMRLTEVQLIQANGAEQTFRAVDTSAVDGAGVAYYAGGTVENPTAPTAIIGAVESYANTGVGNAAVTAHQLSSFQIAR